MKVTLRIVETIHYGADFELAELQQLVERGGGAPLHVYEGDVQAWVEGEARDAMQEVPMLMENIEHNSGDVQGQTWTWAVEP